MTQLNKIQIFSDHKVRTVWDSENEKWYFSLLTIFVLFTVFLNIKKELFKFAGCSHKKHCLL